MQCPKNPRLRRVAGGDARAPRFTPGVWLRLCRVREYRTIDPARSGYERVRTGEAVRETSCYRGSGAAGLPAGSPPGARRVTAPWRR